MSGVFQNTDPHRPASVYPPPLVRVGVHIRWAERGVGGGSIFWKITDTALYSTYVSTLWSDCRKKGVGGGGGGEARAWKMCVVWRLGPAVPAHSDAVSCLDWSGGRLASGGWDGRVRVWRCCEGVEGGEPLIAADGLLELNLGKCRGRAFAAVVRIRIHMFLGLSDLSIILLSSSKVVRKPLIPTVLWLLLDFISLKN